MKKLSIESRDLYMPQTFLVVDTTGRKDYPIEALEKLSDLNVIINSRLLSDEDEIIEECYNADIILVSAADITRRVIRELKSCKGIVRYGTGIDNIDLKAASEKKIVVANVPDFCTDEVADHCLLLILACARRLLQYNKQVKQGKWDGGYRQTVYRLKNKTVGIIGMGSIGKSLADRVRALKMSVIAFDPYQAKAYGNYNAVKFVDLHILMKEADFISINCPLNSEIYHLIGERELEFMKPTAYIINVTRGGIIHENALIDSLRHRAIAGAGLDVLEVEPPSLNNVFFQLDNVILTPHIAWYSEEAYKEVEIKAFEQVSKILRESQL